MKKKLTKIEREKLIIESFAKNFNKIKRSTDNNIKGVMINDLLKEGHDFDRGLDKQYAHVDPTQQSGSPEFNGNYSIIDDGDSPDTFSLNIYLDDGGRISEYLSNMLNVVKDPKYSNYFNKALKTRPQNFESVLESFIDQFISIGDYRPEYEPQDDYNMGESKRNKKIKINESQKQMLIKKGLLKESKINLFETELELLSEGDKIKKILNGVKKGVITATMALSLLHSLGAKANDQHTHDSVDHAIEMVQSGGNHFDGGNAPDLDGDGDNLSDLSPSQIYQKLVDAPIELTTQAMNTYFDEIYGNEYRVDEYRNVLKQIKSRYNGLSVRDVIRKTEGSTDSSVFAVMVSDLLKYIRNHENQFKIKNGGIMVDYDSSDGETDDGGVKLHKRGPMGMN